MNSCTMRSAGLPLLAGLARRGRGIDFILAIAGMLSWGAGAAADTIAIQAKSYIASVNLMDPNQFDTDAKTCQQAMAALVACGTLLAENPPNGGRASGQYRLWSEVSVDVTCAGNKVATWKVNPVVQDFGEEFVFISTAGDIAKPLSVGPAVSGSNPVDKVTLSYRLRGRPNAVGVAVMEAVKPRACSYIWHEVSGTLTCQQGKPNLSAGIKGSGFPSHKVWVGGNQVAAIAQGPFKNLWRCDASDPTAVK